MTATTKDFAPIQSDYTFFLTHSNESDADLAAYQEELSDFHPAGEAIRMLDFGCGPGTTTERLLSGWT